MVARSKYDGLSPSYSDHYLSILALLDVILLGFHHLHATAFRGTSHFMKNIHRGETHTLLLVRIESLGERPPCIGELFEVGASFRQVLSMHPHDFDWINAALAHLLGQVSDPFNSLVTRLGSGTDGVLYRRPKSCLLRCEFQYILGGSNSRLG